MTSVWEITAGAESFVLKQRCCYEGWCSSCHSATTSMSQPLLWNEQKWTQHCTTNQGDCPALYLKYLEGFFSCTSFKGWMCQGEWDFQSGNRKYPRDSWYPSLSPGRWTEHLCSALQDNSFNTASLNNTEKTLEKEQNSERKRTRKSIRIKHHCIS